MLSEARKKANQKYDAAHYKSINLKIKNEKKQIIDTVANSQNIPVTTFCKLCIDYCINNNIQLNTDTTEEE